MDSLSSGCSSFKLSAGRQIEMRRGVKRKRDNSSSSESREWKRIKLDLCSDSDYSVDSLSLGCSSPASPGDTSRYYLSAGRQIETRRGVKRKRENSSGSESRERKRIKLDLCSDSDYSVDSLSLGCSSPASPKCRSSD